MNVNAWSASGLSPCSLGEDHLVQGQICHDALETLAFSLELFQMHREGFDVARCTVARLMKDIGIEGVIRGKRPRTTIPDKALPCPLDRVNLQFHASAPNVLWVSDFTYVATWQGFVYVAFVIDVFARRIVGWRASRTANAGFVLDALEQAIHQRRPAQDQLVRITQIVDRNICRSMKWSGKTEQRAKMYPTRTNGYENDKATELFRPV